MRKLYKGLAILIISVLTSSLFTMCSNKTINEELAIVKENEDVKNNIEDINIEESSAEETIIEAVEVSKNVKRDYRTNIIGNNEDVVTLMLYICGSDLESDYGTATVDINEILQANINENLNIIIETGGCTDWTNPAISEERNQRFKIENGELVLINDELGLRNMADPNTLTDFITYSKENYPANRYGLIIWNHGSGSIEGFGRDEHFEKESMKICDLEKALKESNTYFDFIGFDACFMSTIEVAYVLEDYADYLIASAEIEPFAGWYYTNWITELANNTSISTLDLAKIIIDDFVKYNSNGEPPEKAILSITDLTEIDYLYNTFCDFINEINIELENESYEGLSVLRSETKTFAENLIDHVDLGSLASSFDTEISHKVIEGINNAVKYSRCTSTMEQVYGLSMYFPYYKMYYYDEFKEAFSNLPLNNEHFDFISNFVTAVKDEKIQIIGEARKSEDEIEANRYN